MKKQTAGRDSLGEFAPKFAELNDDVLFGQIWSREDKLSLRDRSLVTVCIFMGKGLVDDSLKYHLINARNNGLTKEEMAEIITHAAFMPDGQMPGPYSIWQKKYMLMTGQKLPTEECSVWESPMRHMLSTLKVILI